jgi:hypothetical protein
MAKTTGSSSGHKPTQLRVDGQEAKRRVQKQIGAAEILLQGKTVPTPAGVDVLSASATNWENTTRSLLMLLFDSPEYATEFQRVCRRFTVSYGPPTALERLSSTLDILRDGQQNLVGLLDTIDVIVELSDADARGTAPAQVPPVTHGPVHIHIEGDVYGTVAVDTIAKSIENNVKRGLDGQEVADAFTTLAEAFQSDPELDDSARKEALEYLDVLAQESATPQGKRRPAVIATMLTTISAVLGVATKAGQTYDTLQPIIEHSLRASGH